MRRILNYLVARLLLMIPMLFVLLTLVFVVLRVMPGDPVSAMLGGHAPEKVIQEKKKELGLDKPIGVQYLEYLGQLARLDFGKSMILEERVSKPILDKLPATIELTVFGLIICLGIGVPLGVRAARRRRTGHDFGIRLYANVVYCIPVFWMGLMLQMIFGVFLNLFPISGRVGSRVVSGDFDKTGFYIMDTLFAGRFARLGRCPLSSCASRSHARHRPFGRVRQAYPREHAGRAQVRLRTGQPGARRARARRSSTSTRSRTRSSPSSRCSDSSSAPSSPVQS